MKLYIYDEERIYSSEFEVVNPFESLPPRSTPVAPPNTTGSQVARWNGSNWELLPERPIPDPEPIAVPDAVTMRQARLALLQLGKLNEVITVIESLEEPQRSAAMIEWEYSQEVQRTSDFVNLLAPSLGFTSEELDQLFIHAATL